MDKRQARPLPRLVIVIDEFASMARDLPDFVTGLVDIAQRGRSLGVHLILATQRPSGVVSRRHPRQHQPADRAAGDRPRESADVIGTRTPPPSPSPRPAGPTSDSGTVRSSRSRPDGSGGDGRPWRRPRAHSPQAAGGPGASTGTMSPQAAGGPGASTGTMSPKAAGGSGGSPRDIWLAPVDWGGLGRPEPAQPAAKRRADEEITDLKVLVEQIRRAAHRLRIPRQPVAAAAARRCCCCPTSRRPRADQNNLPGGVTTFRSE